jgi:hypothetical protein
MKPLRRLLATLILDLLLALLTFPLLDAQTPTTTLPDTNATAPKATPAGQAPDDVMKKLSDVVHAGKYAEAQQTVAALLILYPDDQRLIKAKTLLDKSLASAGSASPTRGSFPPSNGAANVPAATDTTATQLTGIDKVEYNALIELARQARQDTDLEQQKASLKQFMKDSDLFLQKYPNEILLWQLRAISAISLNDIVAGYDAGQKLLAMGATDSSDPANLAILVQLKNKGWLDKNTVTEFKSTVTEFQKRALQEKFTFQGRHTVRAVGDFRGHLTLNEIDAVYEGEDGTIRFNLDEIREVRPVHFRMTVQFEMKNGKDFWFKPFEESSFQHTNGHEEKEVSDLLDAVVERWKFVSAGTKTWDRVLKPPTH